MVGRTFLGRYEAIRLLGEGGMGRVYLARQKDLGRQVVVKVMHDHVAADPKFRERFQRETLLMARFQHPYVVTLYDASLNDPEGPCIVMEYIKGITLDTMLQRNGPMSPSRVSRVLGQLCEALQAAHAEGIVHRDLKPGNLMVVDADSPYEKVKVMDFGLAKLVNGTAKQPSGSSPEVTGADFAVGTPGYISPEQVRGEELDHRSDLYSLGVILYELLTGKLPFIGAETMDVLLAHVTEPPPAFERMNGGIHSAPVEAVVRRCLAKSPAERYASARDLFDDFSRALTQSNGDLPPPVAEDSSTDDQAPPTTPLIEHAADPHTLVFKMEAWMPDTIASFKLRGFLQDMGGSVLESVPGKLKVRLGGPGSRLDPGGFSWFGLRKNYSIVDLELLLERNNPKMENQLQVTVMMRAPQTRHFTDPSWRDRCTQVYCELRSYLAAASVGTQ